MHIKTFSMWAERYTGIPVRVEVTIRSERVESEPPVRGGFLPRDHPHPPVLPIERVQLRVVIPLDQPLIPRRHIIVVQSEQICKQQRKTQRLRTVLCVSHTGSVLCVSPTGSVLCVSHTGCVLCVSHTGSVMCVSHTGTVL